MNPRVNGVSFAFGTPSLSAHEQAHRRILLVGVATLLVFSTSPVLGHHVAQRADALLTGYDHIGRVCLVALHVLLAPVHTVFHLLLFVGVAYAVWDRARAWYGLERTLRALQINPPLPDDRLSRAARRAGLAPGRVCVVDGLPNPAFTAGFWRPNVYVAASLPDVLDQQQLEAVLAHEAAHVARRDPVRVSLMRFLACTLFYIPALRRLADDLADEAEIDADDAAAARSEPLVLASAILALASWSTCPDSGDGGSTLRPGSAVAFQPFASFQRVDLLERRVRRLAGEPTMAGTHVTRRSLAGAGATLVAVWVSGLMMAHPLPVQAAVAGASPTQHASMSHCEHRGAFALSHLFCLGLHAHPRGTPCPHTGR